MPRRSLQTEHSGQYALFAIEIDNHLSVAHNQQRASCAIMEYVTSPIEHPAGVKRSAESDAVIIEFRRPADARMERAVRLAGLALRIDEELSSAVEDWQTLLTTSDFDEQLEMLSLLDSAASRGNAPRWLPELLRAACLGDSEGN